MIIQEFDFSKMSENSILVVHLPEHMSQSELAKTMGSFRHLVPKDMPVVLLAPGFEIDVVSEKDMNKAGWFKKQAPFA